MAAFWSTTIFGARLKRLQALIVENKLSELRVYDAPDHWGPGEEAEIDDALRLCCAELVVTNESFWFRDQPKTSDSHIESRSHSIADFLASVREGVEPLFLGDNPATLEDLVREHEDFVRMDLATHTNTKQTDWEATEGPETGVGAEYWYINRSAGQMAYVCLDQGEIASIAISDCEEETSPASHPR
jgi:hypothetical protein